MSKILKSLAWKTKQQPKVTEYICVTIPLKQGSANMLEGQPQVMQGGALMGTALKRKQ
jgi:hypothetical protein